MPFINTENEIYLCGIYGRLSLVNSGKQDEGDSIENQLSICRRFVDGTPELKLADTYVDMKIAKMIQRAGIEYRENRRKYRLLAHLLLPEAFIFLRLNTA